jgi:hypothetical protein
MARLLRVICWYAGTLRRRTRARPRKPREAIRLLVMVHGWEKKANRSGNVGEGRGTIIIISSGIPRKNGHDEECGLAGGAAMLPKHIEVMYGNKDGRRGGVMLRLVEQNVSSTRVGRIVTMFLTKVTGDMEVHHLRRGVLLMLTPFAHWGGGCKSVRLRGRRGTFAMLVRLIGNSVYK